MKSVVMTLQQLDPGLILTPERYATKSADGVRGLSAGISLGELVYADRATVSPRDIDPASRYLIADTGDAFEGILSISKPTAESVGSTKKILQPGDVIVSRLRPYLRQVAYLDAGLFLPGVRLVCSTEFYVLRGTTASSIAYLVPWLLSAPVQASLAAGQEGGHHPRFSESTLMRLCVSDEWHDRRDESSAAVVKSVALFRQSKDLLLGEIGLANPKEGEG